MPAKTPVSRDALIEEYRDYVGRVVGQLIKTMGLPVESSDEFTSAGYLGLVEAADRFDFNAGKPFKNYAFLRIRGAIIDSIRQTAELRGKAYRCAQVLKASHDLRETLLPEDVLSDTENPMTLSEILEYAGRSTLAYRMSLCEIEDTVTTEGAYGDCPEDVRLAKEKLQKMYGSVATLPEKERIVIEGFYFQGKTYDQIGDQIGASKSWVSRMHARALGLLLRKLTQDDETE